MAAGGFTAMVVRDGMAEPFRVARLASWAPVIGGMLAPFVFAHALWELMTTRLVAMSICSATVFAATRLVTYPGIALFAVVAVRVAVASVLAIQVGGSRPLRSARPAGV